MIGADSARIASLMHAMTSGSGTDTAIPRYLRGHHSRPGRLGVPSPIVGAGRDRFGGVSETTAARWERGERLPDAWELRELCRVLDVEPSDLLSPEPMTDREVLLARRAGRAI